MFAHELFPSASPLNVGNNSANIEVTTRFEHQTGTEAELQLFWWFDNVLELSLDASLVGSSEFQNRQTVTLTEQMTFWSIKEC
jgi:hypothetical protein